jgi:hypothetical protein
MFGRGNDVPDAYKLLERLLFRQSVMREREMLLLDYLFGVISSTGTRKDCSSAGASWTIF